MAAPIDLARVQAAEARLAAHLRQHPELAQMGGALPRRRPVGRDHGDPDDQRA
jgi:hypothetical protein